MFILTWIALIAWVGSADYEVILNHENVDNGFFSSSLKSTGLENENDPAANTYSIIGNFGESTRSSYRDNNGAYQFKLVNKYRDGSTDQVEWTQTSWLTDSTITGFNLISAVGVDGNVYDVDADRDDSQFYGLGLSTSSAAYLDGNGGTMGSYWQAVGAIYGYGGGIPSLRTSVENMGKGPAMGQTLYIVAPQEIILLNHENVDNGFFSSSLKSTGLENENDPTANTYSIIGTFDESTRSSYRDDNGAYRFRLVNKYRDGSTDQVEWTQTSWLTASTITGFSLLSAIGVDGNVYDIEADRDDSQFYGLGLSTSSAAYLDGNGGTMGSYWQAVGAIYGYGGGIPSLRTSVENMGKGPAMGQTLYIVATQDVDECALGTDSCDVNAQCTNTEGSYTCTCNDGYTGDGFECVDVDECALGTHTCDDNAVCTNTDGGYTCVCNDGYSGDGFVCVDIDECTLGTDDCGDRADGAQCVNIAGSYECECSNVVQTTTGCTQGETLQCTDVSTTSTEMVQQCECVAGFTVPYSWMYAFAVVQITAFVAFCYVMKLFCFATPPKYSTVSSKYSDSEFEETEAQIMNVDQL